MSKKLDKEIIEKYNSLEPELRKDFIERVAEKEGLQPWDLADALKEAGCEVRYQWFAWAKKRAKDAKNELKTAEKNMEGGNASYLRRVIVAQDKTLKEDAEKIRKLEAQLAEYRGQEEIKVETAQMIATLKKRDEEIAALEAELDGYRAAADVRAKLLAELEQQTEVIAHQKEALRAVLENYEADAAPARHFFGIEGKEREDAGPAQVSAAADGFDEALACFLQGLSGRSAYLCGRILEALWCWKYRDDRETLSMVLLMVREILRLPEC